MKKKIFFVSFLTITMNLIQAQNPFFSAYKTPYDTPPFDKIKNEHYELAVDKGIKEHQAELDKIVMIRAVPTFENTILPYEESGKLLSRVSSVFFNLLSAESNDEMMEIAQRIQPKLSQHSNETTLNEGLFLKIKAVYDKRFDSNLNPEQIRLVEKIYQSFENRGATLVGQDREKYKELSSKLSQLTLTFGQNVLKEGNKFEMILTDDSDLAGLPQMVKDAAAVKAMEKGKIGYLFDLSAPSYIAFMKYSSRRDLREKLYMAYSTKCVVGGEFDNQDNVKEIAKTRMEIAKLLGYTDYASYILKNKMAKDKEHVYKLLDDLYEAYGQAAREDVKMVDGFAVGLEGKSIDLRRKRC